MSQKFPDPQCSVIFHSGFPPRHTYKLGNTLVTQPEGLALLCIWPARGPFVVELGLADGKVQQNQLGTSPVCHGSCQAGGPGPYPLLTWVSSNKFRWSQVGSTMEDPGSSPTAGCDAGQTQLTTTCAVEGQEVDGQCYYYYDDYYIIIISIMISVGASYFKK